ncbi:MAG: methyltransferase domain-containing protein [Dehalococcoidia bacterium]
MAGTVQQQFGPVAAAYAVSAVHTSGPDLDAAIEAADPQAADLALDIATGAGFTAFALAARCLRVTALDLTPEMLAQARRIAAERGLSNVEFVEGDAEKLPFGDSSFDVVTCRVSAHHFGDVPRFLGEVARVLRPGGRLAVVDTISPEDPALDSFCNAVELLRDPSHGRNYTATEWLRMCGEAGLSGAAVVMRSGYVLDGQSWVERMRTAPGRVAAIRELFATATAAQRAYFELRDEPWGWTLPYLVLSARHRA